MRAPDVVFSVVFFLVIGVIGGSFIGESLSERNMLLLIESEKQHNIEQGYIQAYVDQVGKDIGVPVAKCKLSGGEPVVNGKRVACLKEMTND